MRVRKYGHACVRIEADAVLVIDPGVYTERAALDGADAVLITHEHVDHLDVDALGQALSRRPRLRVFAHPSLRDKLADHAAALTTVSAGDSFEAAGLPVHAYGGWHAEIHPDIPQVPNLGYLVAGVLYHPGDSFFLPSGATVDTLFVPVSAPWLKLAEAVDFVRAVAPRRAFALHDAILSETGHQLTTGVMRNLVKTDYARLAPGDEITVPVA